MEQQGMRGGCPVGERVSLLLKQKRKRATSGRFSGNGWRLDVYIDFLGLAAATAEKLAAEEKERGGNDDNKDHEYGHHCRVAAATVIISHKIILIYTLMIRFSAAM